MSVITKVGGGFLGLCFLGLAGLGVAIAAKAVFRSDADETPIEQEPELGAIAPAATPQRTPLDEVMAALTTSDAVEAARPYFGDTVDQPSPGASMLAIWMAKRGGFAASSNSALTLKMAKKDIASARGSQLCVRGQIAQIERDRSIADPLFMGTLMTDSMDFVHYFAAGSTGTLVDGDTAKFCGIVTGEYSYANVSGGQTRSIQLVGVFMPAGRGLSRL